MSDAQKAIGFGVPAILLFFTSVCVGATVTPTLLPRKISCESNLWYFGEFQAVGVVLAGISVFFVIRMIRRR